MTTSLGNQTGDSANTHTPEGHSGVDLGEFEAVQRRAELRITKAAKDAEVLQSQMEQLTHTIDTALSLKNDLARFEGQDGKVKELLLLTADLRTDLDSVQRAFEGVR